VTPLGTVRRFRKPRNRADFIQGHGMLEWGAPLRNCSPYWTTMAAAGRSGITPQFSSMQAGAIWKDFLVGIENPDNLLRQVVYEGPREDKPAAEVRREHRQGPRGP
jgi:hypothetical protein